MFFACSDWYVCLCRGHVAADVVWQANTCSFQRRGCERSVILILSWVELWMYVWHLCDTQGWYRVLLRDNTVFYLSPQMLNVLVEWAVAYLYVQPQSVTATAFWLIFVSRLVSCPSETSQLMFLPSAFFIGLGPATSRKAANLVVLNGPLHMCSLWIMVILKNIRTMIISNEISARCRW